MFGILRLLFVSLPFLIVSFIIGVLTLNYRFERWMRIYRPLVNRYSGRLDSFFFRPRLSFQYLGWPVTLWNRTIRLVVKSPATVLELSVEKTNEGLIVVDRKLASLIRMQRRYRPIATGDPQFDQAFEVRVWEKGRMDLAELLPVGTRNLILELQRKFPKDYVGFSIQDRTISLVKTRYIKDAGELSEFLRLCLKAIDGLLFGKTKGLEFMDVSPGMISKDAKCPVCSGIPNDAVVCNSCHTPHCRECWTYNGRCAMFACGETVFSQPKVQPESANSGP